MEIMYADISGLASIGPVKFVRAEWWGSSSRLVVLRYEYYGKEEVLGLRMDLDKRAILDSVEDVVVDAAVKRHGDEIWEAVAEERTRGRWSVTSSDGN